MRTPVVAELPTLTW